MIYPEVAKFDIKYVLHFLLETNPGQNIIVSYYKFNFGSNSASWYTYIYDFKKWLNKNYNIKSGIYLLF